MVLYSAIRPVWLVLTISASLLLAAAAVVLIAPAIVNAVHLHRRKTTKRRRARRIARANARPVRFDAEGREAFLRAKRFMLKSDTELSPALVPELIRYRPKELWLQGEAYRGKTNKTVLLRAQVLCAADLVPREAFGGDELEASEVTDGGRWAVVVHGYRTEGNDLLLESAFFMERGYNVLLPDLRGHGGSGGTYVSMGWQDRLDLAAWCRLLAEKYPGCKIVLYGVSMGGAAVMMASGEPLPPNVRCVIEDCGYTSAWDEFRYQYRKNLHIPARLLLGQGSLYAHFRYGFGFREASAVDQLKKNGTLPVLFLHGSRDGFVPARFASDCYAAAATTEKRLAVFDGAAHAQSMRVAFREYWKEVDGFLEKYD